MKTLTFKRGQGWKSAVEFANGKSFGVSIKTYATKRGAEGANTKLRNTCGENWENNDMLWEFTNDDGEVIKLYKRESRVSL